jgi:hypothetical protein
MALQNLQQYGCQTGNKLKEKSRHLNRISSRNKNETMFGSGCENCPEFGVLGGDIFKLDKCVRVGRHMLIRGLLFH